MRGVDGRGFDDGMPRAPLAALVTRWAMNATRAGVDVPPRVVVLLVVLAERMNHATGIARPGYSTLARDTGWSEDAIRDAGREASRLGALEVRTFRGRGLAAEFKFTAAVYDAPNLDTFADLDREKTLPASHLYQPRKGGSDAGEKVAGGNGKGGPPATPTVGLHVSTTEERQPSLPPAAAGGAAPARAAPQGRLSVGEQAMAEAAKFLGSVGRPRTSPNDDDELNKLREKLVKADAQRIEAERAERKLQRRAQRELAEEVIAYVIATGGRAPRQVRRAINDWARAGFTLDQMRAGIDAGHHLPKARL
jgi:hypothetical protein